MFLYARITSPLSTQLTVLCYAVPVTYAVLLPTKMDSMGLHFALCIVPSSSQAYSGTINGTAILGAQ